MPRIVSGIVVLAVLMLYSGLGASAPVLVDGDWLEKRLNDESVVIVDMSAANMQYQRFHLPGAVHLPYQAIVAKRRDGVSVRVSDQQLTTILGLIGVTADKHVVIYDDMGGLEAGRLFWELERIGHEKVSVLDGGLVQWVLDRRPLTNKPAQPAKTVYTPAGKGRDNEADLAGVKAVLEDGATRLLDVRSDQEYFGDPRQPRSGHIPGAKLWSWNGSVDFSEGFKLRDREALLSELKALDIKPDQPVVTYCRSGHRAAQNYLVLRHLGFDKVRLYDGSMAEWERDQSLPVEKGRK